MRVVLRVPAHERHKPDRLLHRVFYTLLHYRLQATGQRLEIACFGLHVAVELVLHIELTVPFLKVRGTEYEHRPRLQSVTQQRAAILSVGVNDVQFRAAIHKLPLSRADMAVGALELPRSNTFQRRSASAECLPEFESQNRFMQ